MDTQFIYFTSIIAQEQEDEEGEDEEGEDEEEEDDDNEEDEEEEAEEKTLKKMEEQRSQGKVRDSWSLFSLAMYLFSCFYKLAESLSTHLSSFQSLQVKVTPGKVKVENPARLEQEEKAEEKRLAIMMMKKKEKYLYDKIMFGKKRKVREVCSILLIKNWL